MPEPSPFLNKRNAFTLIEAVLALTIGAVILASLTSAFIAAREAWNKSTQMSELMQHARVAMARMTNELKYSHRLVQATNDLLEFETKTLLDWDEMTIETIRYEKTGMIIMRAVNGALWATMAGHPGEVNTIAFDVDPRKINATGDLVSLDAGDPLSVAVAVFIGLTFQDKDLHTFRLESLAALRNK